MNCPFKIVTTAYDEIPLIDEWQPLSAEDYVFGHCNKMIFVPAISTLLGIAEPEKFSQFATFSMVKKRCYNNEEMRKHTCHYLNYFIKFYDHDKQLLTMYARIKYMIDFEALYNEDAFKYDLKKYITSENLLFKIWLMDQKNYSIDLNYKNSTDNSLQYTNEHGRILMQMSVLINMMIPLVTHYMHIKGVFDTNNFIQKIFDIVFELFEDTADIMSKLYETSMSTVQKSEKYHSVLWQKQDIRGKNISTHSLDTISNIVINIMPKYTYSRNIINFNYQSIKQGIGYHITGISYEFVFNSLSGTNRDADDNSEFDKYESYLIKQDESLFIQNNVNSRETMKMIEHIYGPFNQDEVDFYSDSIDMNNEIQKRMVFNLFSKYFGDPKALRAINKEDYAKLIIAGKNMLIAGSMKILPYVLSGKLVKMVTRKDLNKKEQEQLLMSESYELVRDKYKSEKVVKSIRSEMATILSSEFKVVEYLEQDQHGIDLPVISQIILEEYPMFVLLIG